MHSVWKGLIALMTIYTSDLCAVAQHLCCTALSPFWRPWGSENIEVRTSFPIFHSCGAGVCAADCRHELRRETRGVPLVQSLAKTHAKPQITSQISVSGDRPNFCPHSHTKEPWRLQNETCFKNIQHTQGFLLKQMFWYCDRRDLLELEEILAGLAKLRWNSN